MRTLDLMIILLALALCANAEHEDRTDPVLRASDLPGFYLHTAYVEPREVRAEFAHLYPHTREFLDYEELWMTVSKATWNRAARPRLVSQQTVIVNRWVFVSVEEARRYAEQVYSLSHKRNPVASDHWALGAPSGKKVGDQSWYVVNDAPANGPDQVEEARRVNQERLKMVVISRKTVITFEAYGSKDRPIDRGWAEGIVRLIAARV